jgi:hypothetical protein
MIPRVPRDQYIPLLIGIPLPFGNHPTVLAIPVRGVVDRRRYHRGDFQRATGSVYLGAFINSLLITWSVVAGQATHFRSDRVDSR